MSKRGMAGGPKRGKPDKPHPAFPVHEHIGRQLKNTYDEIATQPVPDEMRKLLDELERKRS
jgi:hypothetical protein